MARGDQVSKDVDDAVDQTAMTSVLNLQDVLELTDGVFDDGPFA